MNQPLLVAVTQRVDVYPNREERRDALDQRLISLLLAAGLIPAPVPNFLCAQEDEKSHILKGWLQRIKPGAIVLSGGNDLGDCVERDRTESYLLDYAKKRGLPVLGICRGMQQMGVWAGADLIEVEGHVRTRHILRSVFGKYNFPTDVNSYHRWSLDKCPQGFEVLAYSEDGQIEAIQHKEMPWEGWMWHPEREASYSLADIKRIKVLFGVDDK